MSNAESSEIVQNPNVNYDGDDQDANMDGMLIHFSNVHEERFYPCEYPNCDLMFTTTNQLQEHVRIHKEEKNTLICPTCNRGFRHYSSLWTHLKVHSDDKPHVCGVCQRGFKYKGNLTRHNKIHTGDKPFSCSACGKAYGRNDQLKLHLNKCSKVHRFYDNSQESSEK